MIGSSVVPGLPNRCVMPSSLSSARNAERPVMRFMKILPFPRLVGLRGLCIMTDPGRRDQESELMSALRGRTPHHSEHPLKIAALLLFRALADHAGKALQRPQRVAGIGPFLHLLDRDVIERL